MREGSGEHLLVVTTNFLQTTGGVQEHLRALLPRVVDRGLTTTVVYLGEPEPPRVWEGVRVLTLQRRLDVAEVLGVPRPDEWRRVSTLVHQGRLLGGPPVTHVATHTRFFPMSWLGVRLGRSLGVPVVHTEHGGGHVVTSSRVLQQGSRAVDLTMGRQVLQKADRVLAVSRRAAAFVREMSGVRAEVLSNGVDLGAWERPAELPAAGGPLRPLVFVGRLVQEKGWRDFVEVVDHARAAGWAGPAHVFGAGPDRARAEAEVTRRGLTGVTFHGHASPVEMRPVLSGAVYVNPSRASEGFQLTLVEAVAAGAAVATYAVGVADELVELPSADVLVVPQGDVAGLGRAAATLLRHEPPQVVPSELARWDWDEVADRYVSLVRSTRAAARA